MIDYYMAILCILQYKVPDHTATAAQVAEIGKWSEEEADEMLYKLSTNQVLNHCDLVELNNTNPTTYSLVDTSVCNPIEDLEAFLAKR